MAAGIRRGWRTSDSGIVPVNPMVEPARSQTGYSCPRKFSNIRVNRAGVRGSVRGHGTPVKIQVACQPLTETGII
jgi:hypothetical protein